MTSRPQPTCEQKALELLARRAHFRAELARKLAQRGYESAEIEETLDRLTELGYLNEGELAEREAARLRDRRGLGRAGVAASLARRGAGADARDAALGEEDREGEAASARRAAEKWLRAGRRDGAALARHLDRRGFAGHAIFRVLNELGLRAEAGAGPGPEAGPSDSDPSDSEPTGSEP